jgi:HEAT repeat protein
MDIDTLIDRLCDEDAGERLVAIRALADYGEAAVPALIDALHTHHDERCRFGLPAVTALAEIGEPAVEPLLALLQSGDIAVSTRAADALGRIGATEAILPLLHILYERDAKLTIPDWRHFAFCLASIGEPALSVLLDGFDSADGQQGAGFYASLLGFFRQGALEALAERLTAPQPEARRRAMWALTEYMPQTAQDTFITFADDPDPTMRSLALWGLRFATFAEVGDVFAARAGDPDPNVRRFVCDILPMFEDAAAYPILNALAHDNDSAVRDSARSSIEALRDRLEGE